MYRRGRGRRIDCSLIASTDEMIEKVARSHARFNVNMARIAGLMKLVMSDEGQFKPTGFMKYEGVSADILRLIVVFLHAAVEDLVRSQLPDNKSFSFQSGRDIDKAIHRAGFDSSSLKPLYPPLTAMAKRRNRIVHEADLTGFHHSCRTMGRGGHVANHTMEFRCARFLLSDDCQCSTNQPIAAHPTIRRHRASVTLRGASIVSLEFIFWSVYYIRSKSGGRHASYGAHPGRPQLLLQTLRSPLWADVFATFRQ
jgi:hypothetical protein